jgi:hypothetical protein
MLDLNESKTKKKLIDPMLAVARWGVVSYDEAKS